jgi:hypothetical protein
MPMAVVPSSARMSARASVHSMLSTILTDSATVPFFEPFLRRFDLCFFQTLNQIVSMLFIGGSVNSALWLQVIRRERLP